MTTAESKEDRYERLAIRLVRALMRSASPQVIPPIQWWSRAKSALATAASQCRVRGRYSVMISKMAASLQIESLRPRSALAVTEVEREIAADEIYDFAETCERDAVYIVAKAAIENKEEREAWLREEAELSAATAESLTALQTIVDTIATTTES